MRIVSLISHNKIQILTAFIAACLFCSCSDSNKSQYQGYVEGEFVYIASPFGGRLDQLMVRRGQQITTDSPLFYLESEDEREAVRQADEAWRAVIATLEDAKKGKRPDELDVIRAQIAEAVANEKNSAIQLKRDQEQYAAGGISKAQLDNTRYAHDADVAKVVEMQKQLASAKLPAREDQIKSITAQVAAAYAVLGQAKWKLGQKSVNATQTGLVFDTLYRLGEWVPAGQPVIQMLPPENIKVRFFVPEKELAKIKIGQTVQLAIDNMKKPISAKINYISTYAEYSPPVIYSNETRAKLVFMVEAHPSLEQAPRLHPGQPISVIVSS